eukprot:SAG11_NODE_12395_length_705_cov_3.848185_1_plen_175_part_01
MSTYYFYKIINDIDDDVYVGSTLDPRQRWSQLRSIKKGKCVINHKMMELGREHFSFHIIETGEFECKQDALEREDELILKYKAINKNCASSKQMVINKKIYSRAYKMNNHAKILDQNKEYNNRPEVKQRKSEWSKKKHAETYTKGCPMQKAKTKAYYDANKEKKQQYHYNRWELK